MIPLTAIPASNLVRDAAARERLEPLADAWEVRDHYGPATFETDRPVLYHAEQSLLAPLDLDRVLRRIERYAANGQLVLVSLHALSVYTEPVLAEGMFQPGGRRMDEAELLDHARANVEALRRTLGSDVVVAVENNNRYPTPAYDVVTEPAFLARLVEASGAAFLFDVAHAAISAHNLGRDWDGYRNGLPLAHAVQLHVSGWREADPTWFDTHEEPTFMQWERVKSEVPALGGLRFATVEYYRDLDGLMRQLDRLRALLCGAGAEREEAHA